MRKRRTQGVHIPTHAHVWYYYRPPKDLRHRLERVAFYKDNAAKVDKDYACDWYVDKMYKHVMEAYRPERRSGPRPLNVRQLKNWCAKAVNAGFDMSPEMAMVMAVMRKNKPVPMEHRHVLFESLRNYYRYL